jgi:hypothetical protein
MNNMARESKSAPAAQKNSLDDINAQIAALIEAKKQLVKEECIKMLVNRNEELKTFFDTTYTALIAKMEQLDKDLGETEEGPSGSLKALKNYHDIKTKEIYDKLGVKPLLRKSRTPVAASAGGGERGRGRGPSSTILALQYVVSNSAEKRWTKFNLTNEVFRHAQLQKWDVTREQIEAILNMKARYSKIGLLYDRGLQEFYPMR